MADLLAALDPEQRQVAEALRGPVRVLAGAGTGKTRAITHRIAHGVATNLYAPHEVLAVTFTTRAAAEMRSRLRVLGAGGVQARTFHSAALRQLRYFWPHAHGTELPQLIESKLGLLAAAARRQRLNADQATLRDLASEIEWAKVSNVGPARYAAAAADRNRSVTGQTPEAVARLFDAYEEEKRAQGRMDMEDVLLLTAGLLAEDERVAAQVRRQYKWFVVDEFQDVSPIQSALLDLWLGGRNELCVVGDPAQTIYSFAGRQRRLPAQLPRQVPRHDLDRAHPQLPIHARRWSTRPTGCSAGTSSQGVALRAQRPTGSELRLQEHSDESAEAVAVATRIEELRRAGQSLAEIAVLFRINAQSETFEEALAGRGIPYVIRGASRFFDRPEVREAVTRIRGAARSGEADAAGDGLAETVRSTLAGMGWSEEPPAARGQTRDRWESWQSLHDLAVQFASSVDQPGEALARFVDDLDRRAAEQHAPVADGVTLATFHAAKGLEWDAVFLCGLQDGTLPITYADTPSAVEEERRLLYVGHDASPQRAEPLLVARPAAGRPRLTQTVALPHPAPSRLDGGVDLGSRQPQQAGRADVSRVRASARQRRGEEGRTLRGLPGVLRRGPLRAAPGVAQSACRGGVGAGVRRVQRRHPPADRRAQAVLGHRPAGHLRHRSAEARTLRRRRPRAGQRHRRLRPWIRLAGIHRKRVIKWFAHDMGCPTVVLTKATRQRN